MLEKHKLIKIFLSIIWLKFYLAKYRTENNFGILCLLIRCIKIDDNDNGSRLAWYEREFSSTTKRRIILRPENNWARRGVATPTQQARHPHETGGIRQGFFAPILMMKIYSITLLMIFLLNTDKYINPVCQIGVCNLRYYQKKNCEWIFLNIDWIRLC